MDPWCQRGDPRRGGARAPLLPPPAQRGQQERALQTAPVQFVSARLPLAAIQASRQRASDEKMTGFVERPRSQPSRGVGTRACARKPAVLWRAAPCCPLTPGTPRHSPPQHARRPRQQQRRAPAATMSGHQDTRMYEQKYPEVDDVVMWVAPRARIFACVVAWVVVGLSQAAVTGGRHTPRGGPRPARPAVGELRRGAAVPGVRVVGRAAALRPPRPGRVEPFCAPLTAHPLCPLQPNCRAQGPSERGRSARRAGAGACGSVRAAAGRGGAAAAAAGPGQAAARDRSGWAGGGASAGAAAGGQRLWGCGTPCPTRALLHEAELTQARTFTHARARDPAQRLNVSTTTLPRSSPSRRWVRTCLCWSTTASRA